MNYFILHSSVTLKHTSFLKGHNCSSHEGKDFLEGHRAIYLIDKAHLPENSPYPFKT